MGEERFRPRAVAFLIPGHSGVVGAGWVIGIFADQMVEDIQARRNRWGISYYVVHEPYLDDFAPVVDGVRLSHPENVAAALMPAHRPVGRRFGSVVIAAVYLHCRTGTDIPDRHSCDIDGADLTGGKPRLIRIWVWLPLPGGP